MFHVSWRRLLIHGSIPSRRQSKRKARRRNGLLYVEQLEKRELLAAVNTPYPAELYRELLDREGSANEIASWASHLDQGATRFQVARYIMSSPEYLTLVVKGL